jgi:hypothetical protein
MDIKLYSGPGGAKALRVVVARSMLVWLREVELWDLHSSYASEIIWFWVGISGQFVLLCGYISELFADPGKSVSTKESARNSKLHHEGPG